MQDRLTEGVLVQDRLSVERWINEGGRVATEAVIQHEIAAEDATHVRPQDEHDPDRDHARPLRPARQRNLGELSDGSPR